MGWMRWLLATIRPNDLAQRPVTCSLAACTVSFDWATTAITDTDRIVYVRNHHYLMPLVDAALGAPPIGQ